ncbi:MAG: hypothetical protein QW568_00525 [Candidatus Anstonellaceae archaeon]
MSIGMKTAYVANLAIRAGAANGQANTFAQKWTAYTIAKSAWLSAPKNEEKRLSPKVDEAKAELKIALPQEKAGLESESGFAQRLYDLAKAQYRKHKALAIGTGIVAGIALVVGGFDAFALSRGKDIVGLITKETSKLQLPTSAEEFFGYYIRPLAVGGVGIISAAFSIFSRGRKKTADQVADSVTDVAKVKMQYDY